MISDSRAFWIFKLNATKFTSTTKANILNNVFMLKNMHSFSLFWPMATQRIKPIHMFVNLCICLWLITQNMNNVCDYSVISIPNPYNNWIFKRHDNVHDPWRCDSHEWGKWKPIQIHRALHWIWRLRTIQHDVQYCTGADDVKCNAREKHRFYIIRRISRRYS